MTLARTPQAPRTSAHDLDGTLERLSRLLEGVLGGEHGQHAPDALLRLVVPAIGLDPRAVLRVPSPDAFLWEPADGLRLGGLGRAALLSGSGRERLLAVAEAAESVTSRLVQVGVQVDEQIDGATLDGSTPALFVGGGAFRPDGATRARWDGFGDASFVLPRWLVREEERGLASLELTVDAAGLAAQGADPLLAEAERLLLAPAPELGRAPIDPIEATWIESDSGRADWYTAIDGILEAIRRGEVRKAVAARWLDVRLPYPAPRDGEPDDPAAGVLERIVARFEQACSGCVRFVVQRGGRAFVGASPELLLRIEGLDLVTHALAGTERNDAWPAETAGHRWASDRRAARRLLSRDKDRREHQLVVEHIVDRLAPYCSELEVPSEPRVRSLRHLLHLETPIRGRLSAPRHLLELASELHPTPAVAGVPVAASLALLSALEIGERGWYAGPVGWFDQRGDGALSVALRSMLVGRSSARLFAGSGIVADSEPAAELEETRWKLAGAWSALAAAVDGAIGIEEARSAVEDPCSRLPAT